MDFFQITVHCALNVLKCIYQDGKGDVMSTFKGVPMIAPAGNTEQNVMGATKKDKDKSNKKPKRSRSLMYVQQIQYLPSHFKNRQDIENHLNKHFPDAEWAYILHDKDFKTKKVNEQYEYVLDENGDKIPLEPHIHIAFYFPNPRTPAGVAGLMGEPKEDKGKTVEVFESRWAKNNMFAYLIHATDRAERELKHKYDISEVTANFDYAAFMGRVKNTADANKLDIDDVQARIISGELILKDFFRDGKLGSAQVAGLFYTKHKTKIDRAIESKYKIQMSSKGDVDLEVIYIQGPAGSGKTTIAKQYAERKYGDYFISGSSNDTAQDYMGEPVAIFDDARPSDFNASDWLKLLDPYNNKSTVTSRYYNKYLAVDAIILTTTTDFKEFFLYAKEKGGVDEPIDQFIRRFNMVIKVHSATDDKGKTWAVGDLFEVKRVQPYREFLGSSGQSVTLSYDIVQLPYQIKEAIPEKNNNKSVQDFTKFFDSTTIQIDSSADEKVEKKEVKPVKPVLDELSRMSRFA